MKKTVYNSIIILVAAVAVIFVISIENSKGIRTNNHNRFQIKCDGIEESKKNKVDNMDSQYSSSKNEIDDFPIVYKVLSWEIFDESEVLIQKKYKEKFFAELDVFDINKKDEIIDYDAISAESDELNDIWNDTEGKYTYSEKRRIEERNKDIIKKHTRKEHIKRKVLFVEIEMCNRSNMDIGGKNGERFIDLYAFQKNDKNNTVFTGDIVYNNQVLDFENEEERMHGFIQYELKKGETKKFIIGFILKMNRFTEHGELFIGKQPQKDEWDLEEEKNIVSLGDIIHVGN